MDAVENMKSKNEGMYCELIELYERMLTDMWEVH